MILDAKSILRYMDKDSESQFLGKIRRALIFSVLAIIMKNLNQIYKPIDILSVAFSVYFICMLLSANTIISNEAQHRYHLTYLLHCICRQCVLVISDSAASSIHMRDVGTQYDNTLLLILSTTIFVAVLTFVPEWFLHDEQQGSLKDILMFGFTYRYEQVHISGLSSRTGIGTILYGLLFMIFNLLDESGADKTTKSEFIRTLHQAAAMIFSRFFIAQIVPDSNTQVFPIAILLAMYIISENIPMSGSVAALVLWRTAQDVSEWVLRIIPGGTIDQIGFFTFLLCLLPCINRKIAAVFAVAALQTFVAEIMGFFTYLSGISVVMVSVGLLLVTDILLATSE